MAINTEFARLFKKYRLRSEIETLRQFADLMAAEGVVYDTTIYTRWQKGERVPHQRFAVMKMLEIFTKRGGIKNTMEANALLESLQLRDLDYSELTIMHSLIAPCSLASIPQEIDIFVGRDKVIKDVCWDLINNRKVLLHGVPGVGKTALAIHIAHFLLDKFPDGVYWFSGDMISAENIINSLLENLGVRDKSTSSLNEKLDNLQYACTNKRLLLFIDNCDKETVYSTTFRLISKLPIPILFTSLYELSHVLVESRYLLKAFSYDEYIELAVAILGRPFVITNRKNIDQVGMSLDYLPMISKIVLKQVLAKPMDTQQLLLEIEHKKIDFRKMNYDNKTLSASLDIAYSKLSIIQKSILHSTVIFSGPDFSAKAVGSIISLTHQDISYHLNNLYKLSLIEKSSRGRYRLHIALKAYLEPSVNKSGLCLQLLNYYINEFPLLEKAESNIRYTNVDIEYENMLGVLSLAFQFKQYRHFIRLWEKLNNYMITHGKWDVMRKLDSMVIKCFKYTHDYVGLINYYLHGLNRVYYFQGKYKKAMACAKSALILSTKINNIDLIGLSYQRIGIIYFGMQDLTNAIHNLNTGLSMMTSRHSVYERAKGQIYLAAAATKLKQYNTAKEYLDLAVKVSKRQKLNDVLAMAYAYYGDFLYDTCMYNKAQKLYLKSLELELILKRKFGLAKVYYGLGLVARKLHDQKKAKDYFKNSLDLYKELDMKHLYKEVLTESKSK